MESSQDPQSFGGEKRPSFLRIVGVLIVGVFLICAYGFGVIAPPSPHSLDVTIKRGMNADQIGELLKSENIIRSKVLFVWVAYAGGLENRLAAGRVSFTGPSSTFAVFKVLIQPQREVRFVIPEGYAIRDIAREFASIGLGSGEDFIAQATTARVSGRSVFSSIPAGHDLEGFLFPDTYRFFESASASEVVAAMLDNFEKKIDPFTADIAARKKSLFDIVRMASIVEREVSDVEDRALVAGILWKRLEMNMPLQADATLYYETGKGSRELTLDDLKNPTPYNTYTHKGLPPGPIGNPGVEAIAAAVHPEESPYLYYLSDSEGKTHYARTFEEHKKNKIKFLR